MACEPVVIEGPEDDRVADYTQLTDVALRRLREPERGMFIAESSTVIRRAVEAGMRPRSFLMGPKWLDGMADVLDRFPQVPVFTGSDAVLESLTGYHLHRGALAAMQRPELPEPGTLLTGARRVAVVEDIVDHTNLGAIFRSAAALGVDAVLVTPRCADPLYRRSIRVSMGTVFQLPWTRLDSWPGDLALLEELGFHTTALALSRDAVPLHEFAQDPPERIAMIFGTEGDGLSARTVASSRSVVRIDMSHGVDSLNVAAASAVVFYALQRGEPG